MSLRDGFLKNALLVLKHSSDRPYLVNNAGKIFGGIENFSDGEQRKQLTEILASYFLHITELNIEEMNQINAQLPPETVQPFESTAQRLAREGKTEGKTEGEIKLLLKNINVCLNLMNHFPDLTMEEVANISATKLAFAEKLQTAFKGSNEENARKTLKAIFKKYAKFQKLYTKEIEKILTKYLPLFKA